MNDLSPEDKQAILECINVAIQQAPNAINAAAKLLPIVQKLTTEKPSEPKAE